MDVDCEETMTNSQWIRKRLLESIGVQYKDIDRVDPDASMKKILKWFIPIVKLCFNRLVLGRLRYGGAENKKDKYDYIEIVRACLNDYEKDRNKEKLIDAINFLALEFETTQHPKAHFKATDDKEHIRAIQ